MPYCPCLRHRRTAERGFVVSLAGGAGGVLGALRPIEVLLTAFLGAFATAKGLRTLQDYQVHRPDDWVDGARLRPIAPE